MFVWPPKPPKDYVLKNVPRTQLSDNVHTPSTNVRVTQTNFGKYLVPVEYAEDDEAILDQVPSKISDGILEKWTKEAQAWWVDAPGKNAYFLHELSRTHTYPATADDNNPDLAPRNQLFPRSYKYEYECMDQFRREGVEEKCITEQKLAVPPSKEVKEDEPGCYFKPPFWYMGDNGDGTGADGIGKGKTADTGALANKDAKRWMPVPSLLTHTTKTDCRRKYEFSLVGQPFKTEACNWYYENYPMPKYPYRRKRLS